MEEEIYTKEIYIVVWQDAVNGLTIGYLPLNLIPEDSNLRGSLFSVGRHLQLECSAGLRGIYEERYLAEEHMRIEQNWRRAKGVKFWIQTIKAKKERRRRES